MIKRIEVYDLDDTCINSRHRQHYSYGILDLARWRANSTPLQIMEDTLLPTAKLMQDAILNATVFVVVATARELQQADCAFLVKHGMQPNHTISRRAGDSRPDALLKHAGLRRLLSLRQFAGLPCDMYDDKAANLEAVAPLGIVGHLIK